ncbi:mobile element protein [Streptomyces sp. 796.1]|uniref:mobile element protein n=1 Tax=Streptomyces sp. 796.1 TaxID=3163029 RepID=UPI0039C8E9C6
MVAADDYLADPAELAVWLGVPADDLRLLAALTAASRRFRGAVGHRVTLVAGDTVTLDGGGRRSLLLPVWPTIAVSSVRLDDVALVDGTDYSWSESGVLRRLGCGWPDRLRCVRGVYDHGWAVTPEDIQEVVLDQARTIYTVLPGIQSKTVGGQSVTFGAQAAIGVTDQWARAVARHKVRTSGDA